MPGELEPAEKPSSRTIRKRRKAVVDAAARVFAERGYHGASTQDIADLLGMRQASLYYYFHSKEAALEEVCALGTEGFIETAEAVARSGASAEERLRRLLAAHIMPLQDRSDYMLTFLNERKWLPTESRRRIGRLSRRLEAIFERVIREGMRSGEFRGELNPRLTTLGLLGMMNAVASWHDHENATLDKIAEALTDLVLEGTKSGVPVDRKGEEKIL
jgi:AcrR family transcriptional regulator